MVLPILKQNDLTKACFPERGISNRRLQCYRPTQFSGTVVRSENCKDGICALYCAPPRFDLLLYCRRIVQHSVRNCESTLMQLWKWLLFHRCDRLAWRCIRLQWRQKVHSCSAHAKQGGCRVRQQWELGVRFWLFGLHWSSCEKIKMMQYALFCCDLW